MQPLLFRSQESDSVNFQDFVFVEKKNSRLFILTALIVIVQWFGFKLLYPYPDFFDDSYSYLYAAYAHLDISIWPIGYSKFLSAFHSLTFSDIALTTFQYLLMQTANMLLFFTTIYFFKIGKTNRKILWAFLFINPLLLYLCNLVNSDALFAALSIIWITQLIWLVIRPSIAHLLIQALLVFLCFTIRNNAYYYPFVTAIAIILSSQSLVKKCLGIALPLLFISWFVFHTRDASYRLTGTRQFSLFSGWQVANNALYIYDQVKVDSNALPTREAKEINRITTEYFTHINLEEYRPFLESYVGNFFIKDRNSPLKQFYHLHSSGHGEISDIKNWATTSAAVEPFGKSVILHHPAAYLRYFIWPNLRNYLLPPLSNLEKYNYGFHHVAPIAKYWFHYPSTRIHYVSADLQSFLLIYTAFFLYCNTFLFWKATMILYKSLKFRRKLRISTPITIIFAFVLLNFIFSLASTIGILRYQCAPMIVITILGVILDEHQSAFVNLFSPEKRKTIPELAISSTRS